MAYLPVTRFSSTFNYGHIYYYALESIKTVVTENGHQDDEDEEELGHMTAKPLKNGRKYVDSGFVHDMMETTTEEHYFLKAHVWPSMRNELPHNVLIILSVSSGAVIHASCDPCKVSVLGRCSHVVAVLFSLLDHVNEQGPTISTPCTSKECSWNKGKRETKILKDSRRSSILQKGSSAVPINNKKRSHTQLDSRK